MTTGTVMAAIWRLVTAIVTPVTPRRWPRASVTQRQLSLESQQGLDESPG